jgi:hypothetical protein
MPRIFHPVSVVAAVFATLHVILVAVPLISSGGHGEGQAFAVVIFDFPLVWILHQVDWGREILYGNLGANGHWRYVLIFSLGGTIFWASVGALLAYGIKRLLRRRTESA